MTKAYCVRLAPCVHLEGLVSLSRFLLADHPPQYMHILYMHTFIVSEPCPASLENAASQDFLVVTLDSYVYCNMYSIIACY